MDVAWILLVVAGLMEPCWVFTMERSEHFRRAGFTVATVALIVVDLAMLSVAMQDIGAGVAYAVWAGIGAIVTLVMGVLVYRDPMSPARVFFAMVLIVGIVGLHMTTGGSLKWTGTREDGAFS